MTSAGRDESSDDDRPEPSLRQRTLHSLLWQFLGVGGQRIVQLLGPIVLTRLVPKEEIGLFGVVFAAIIAIEALTRFMGEETTIWSQRGAEKRYLDTVFTVHLLRGLLISGLLCALAVPMASFFSDPATDGRYWLPGLFLALAANGLVEGLSSPARALKLKGLAFRQVAIGDFFAVLLGTVLTITLALLWQNVWALLIGHLGATAMKSAISYAVAPYRPRLCIERSVFKELFQYGRGAAGVPFLLVMVFMAPAFVLAKAIGKGAVAVYDFSGRLAKLPEDVFLRVLGPVAVPAYAQLQNDKERLGRAWLQAVRAFLLCGTPLTVTMAWCGNALPTFVFGEGYGEIENLFALQALHGGISGLTAVVGPLFWAVGKPHYDRRAQFCRCLAVYGLGIPAAIWFGVTGFAVAMCIAIGIALVISVHLALAHLGLPLSAFLRTARDGLLAGGALGAALLLIDAVFSPTGFVRLVTAGVTGGPLLGALALIVLKRQKQPPAPIAGEPATAD